MSSWLFTDRGEGRGLQEIQHVRTSHLDQTRAARAALHRVAARWSEGLGPTSRDRGYKDGQVNFKSANFWTRRVVVLVSAIDM